MIERDKRIATAAAKYIVGTRFSPSGTGDEETMCTLNFDPDLCAFLSAMCCSLKGYHWLLIDAKGPHRPFHIDGEPIRDVQLEPEMIVLRLEDWRRWGRAYRESLSP